MLKKYGLIFKRPVATVSPKRHLGSSQFMKARQPSQVGLVVYLMQNLRLRGRPPPIIFARIVRPINALQLCR